MKWYAFIPIIGYALWFREATTMRQLITVFIYQLIVALLIILWAYLT